MTHSKLYEESKQQHSKCLSKGLAHIVITDLATTSSTPTPILIPTSTPTHMPTLGEADLTT